MGEKLCEGPVLVSGYRKGYNMDKEAQDHEFTEASTLESGRETSDFVSDETSDRSEEKELILASVERVREMVGVPVEVILDHLGIPPATYYRCQHRRSTGSLADRTSPSQRRTWPPIPQEIESVRSYALEYPQIGYKRLTWQMIDDDVAYLKAYSLRRDSQSTKSGL